MEFMNFSSCVYLYISLCIEIILSLFMNVGFSCILSRIIYSSFPFIFEGHRVNFFFDERKKNKSSRIYNTNLIAKVSFSAAIDL